MALSIDQRRSCDEAVQFIKTFVKRKTGETVSILLKEDKVLIVPVPNTGSSVLAALWANALQHRFNFPPSLYVYKKQIRPSGQHHRLNLELRDISIWIVMNSGQLKIAGDNAHAWFTYQLPRLISNFVDDAPTHQTSDRVVVDRQSHADERRDHLRSLYDSAPSQMQNGYDKRTAEAQLLSRESPFDRSRPMSSSSSMSLKRLRDHYHDERGVVDELYRERKASLHEHDCARRSSKVTFETFDDGDGNVFHNSCLTGDETNDSDAYESGIWPFMKLERELSSLEHCGAILPARQYVFELFRTLLFRWLRDDSSNIYISSAQIDPWGLLEIGKLTLRTSKQRIRAIYVGNGCPEGLEAKKQLQLDLKHLMNSDDALFLTYSTLERVTTTARKASTANFAASVRDGTAEVLVMSSSIERKSLGNEEATAFVAFFRTTADRFRMQYLDVLEAS